MLNEAAGIALLLATIAGLSTIIGALIVVLTGKMSNKLLAIAMGFASGVMLSACFLDLLPEAEEYFGASCSHGGALAMAVLFMAIGLAAAFLADTMIPHKCGCDHDEHDHACDEDVSRIGIVSMIAIGLHNFPEGIALFLAGYEDTALGVTLAIAVMLHNIPGGITIAAPVYYASHSKTKAILYTLLPSLVQPAGALLACLVLKNIMGDFVMGAMFAVVAGFLLFTALVELYPTSRQYGHHKLSALAMFAGVLLMPLTHILH